MTLIKNPSTLTAIYEARTSDLIWLQKLSQYDRALSVHSFEVAQLTATFTSFLGLPARQQELIYRAALLHDVGKLHVPLHILRKPGTFGEAERSLMRSHASVGAELLRISGETDTSLLQIVHDHHERENGTGYPRGVSSRELNMEVRIVSLCDVLVACTEPRPYIETLNVEEACDLVLDERLGLDELLAAKIVGMVKRKSMTSFRASAGPSGRLNCVWAQRTASDHPYL